MPELQTVDVNPLERAADIKDLFLADNYSEFPAFFDRAYPSAVQDGARSWVGVDAQGNVVTHIARFPRQFTLRDQLVKGGVLLNLIAAKSHRTLLPALALMRKMASDSKAQADVDFLYATPSPAAHALLKAAGFSQVGSLERFVLPLAGKRWYSDASARVYRLIMRMRTTTRGATTVEHAANQFDVSAFARPLGQTPAVRPIHPPELYRQCLGQYPSAADHWFTFSVSRSSGRPSAAALVHGGTDRVALLLSISREPGVPLAAIVPPLATALRRAGYIRLAIATLAGTDFAAELAGAGFIARHDGLPFVALPVTDAGAGALRSLARWEITELDCDPYVY